MMGLLIGLGAFAAWILWLRYQYVRWSDAAGVLVERLEETLKQMSFAALAESAGRPHHVWTEVVDGYPFLLGWEVDLPERLGAFRNDHRAEPIRMREASVGEVGDELTVRCFVDFVYPLVLTKGLHFGLARWFTRRKDAEAGADEAGAGGLRAKAPASSPSRAPLFAAALLGSAPGSPGVTTLSTPLRNPIGLAAAALFLGYLGWAASSAAGTAGAGLTYWVPAAILAWAALTAFRRRHALELMIAADRFSFDGRLVPRADVVAVRRYADLTFKGVRIDLVDGGPVLISASHLDRDEVVRSFGTQGYPIDGEQATGP
jgi:hypothetical protein